MKRSPRRLAPAIALLTLAVAWSAPAATIDLFSSTADGLPFVLTRNTVSSFQAGQSGLADVIGGSRELLLTAQDLALPGLDTVQAGVYPSVGVLDYASSAGADGSLRLVYDASGSGLNADLSGDAFLAIDYVLFDLAGGAPMPVTVMLFSGADIADRTEYLTTAGPQVQTFNFADFSGIGSLDLSHVDRIDLLLDPSFAADFRIDGIRTEVPEPGSFLLLAAAAALMMRRNRT